ncbi:MAG: hypothetical protein PHN88_04560 [Ignavibacteria bacterium]|nr:hypothetical protein [Ignavibacteria bacterium]
MATVVTIGNPSAQNSIYSQICEKLIKAIEVCERDRIFSTYLYFTVISGILQKIGCHPSSITVYKYYERDLENSKKFQNNITYDYNLIYDSLVEKGLLKKLLFSVDFTKPYNYKPQISNSRIIDVQDEVLIDLRSLNENDNYFLAYGDGVKKFNIKDYTNKEETDPLINSIVDDLLKLYENNNTFSKNYLSFRDIYSKPIENTETETADQE